MRSVNISLLPGAMVPEVHVKFIHIAALPAHYIHLKLNRASPFEWNTIFLCCGCNCSRIGCFCLVLIESKTCNKYTKCITIFQFVSFYLCALFCRHCSTYSTQTFQLARSFRFTMKPKADIKITKRDAKHINSWIYMTNLKDKSTPDEVIGIANISRNIWHSHLAIAIQCVSNPHSFRAFSFIVSYMNRIIRNCCQFSVDSECFIDSSCDFFLLGVRLIVPLDWW